MIISFTGNVTDNVSENLTLLDETGGNNMKKKVLALVLALVMSLALVACGGNDDNQTPSTGDQTPRYECKSDNPRECATAYL